MARPWKDAFDGSFRIRVQGHTINPHIEYIVRFEGARKKRLTWEDEAMRRKASRVKEGGMLFGGRWEKRKKVWVALLVL